MQSEQYFPGFQTTAQKQYEALRSHFIDKLPAKESAEKFNYALSAFNSLVASFRNNCKPISGLDRMVIDKKLK